MMERCSTCSSWKSHNKKWGRCSLISSSCGLESSKNKKGIEIGAYTESLFETFCTFGCSLHSDDRKGNFK